MSSSQLKKFTTVKTANIEWRNTKPFNLDFDDIYYSCHGGVEESQHVFINGNNLNEDWNKNHQEKFYLTELGFGGGLNFFNTIKNWIAFKASQRAGTSNKHLHYIAIEKHPFSLKDLKRAASYWPQFNDVSNLLIANYPPQTYGRHQICFNDLNVTLTLLFMPLVDAFSDLISESESQQNKIKIDHWFLDGFAPSKNSSMWGDENAKNIALLSKRGTRLATYSVAASVKAPLKTVGFELKKIKGFAKKREMLTGIFLGNSSSITKSKYINIKYESPWFNIQRNSDKFVNSKSKNNGSNKIAIIGAGIAGCMTAYALHNKGFACDIFDNNQGIAEGASGAAAGIFHPQLTPDMNINSQFSWMAYLRIIRLLDSLSNKERINISLKQGVYRFLESDSQITKIQNLIQTIDLSKWIKFEQLKGNPTLFFPNASALEIPKLCQLIISKMKNDNNNIYFNSTISDIRPSSLQNASAPSWEITTENEVFEYEQIIYCGGAKSALLDQLEITGTHTTRGQTCFFQSDKLAKEIDTTLCEQNYLVPRKNNYFHLGSTFESLEDNKLNLQSQQELLRRVTNFLSANNFASLSSKEILSAPLAGTVGYRLHSNDRMPVVGGIIDEKKLSSDFINLGQRKIERNHLSFYNKPGLWINSAYGSHGLLYALIASEHLVSQITNSISPISYDLAKALSPVRFHLKDLKR